MLPPKKQEIFKLLWFIGVKEDEIAHILGIRSNMVTIYAKILGLPPRTRRSPANKKIRDEDIELIKEMWLNGATIKEIAKYFGVHETTIQQYLHAMGLRRRTVQKCPNIPRDKLEKLCFKGYTDAELAELFNTSKHCIMRLRQKYGINKRNIIKQKHREKINKLIDTIVKILNEKGYTTNIELKEKYNIKVTRDLLERLELAVEGVRWFRLTYTSTAKYTIFSARFNNLMIIYLEGKEGKVITFLLDNVKDANVPLHVFKMLLKINKAPKGLIEFLSKISPYGQKVPLKMIKSAC